MSGSDLAPFVAVVLRDSTVDKLKNENDGLRELLDERLLLQITGQDGSPIHYETSMKNGTSKQGDNERDLWVVNMIGSDNKENTFNDNVIPLNNSIEKYLEIWVGGQFLQRFDLNTCRLRRMIGTNDGFDRDIKDVPQMGLIAILPTLDASVYSSVPIVYAKFGPILFDEYHDLPQQMSMRELIYRRTSNNGASKISMIKRLLFRKSKIRGVVSLLEKLGVSTTTTSKATTAVTAATTVIAANGIDNEEDDDDDNGDAEQ
jgi:hypothetical protein